MIRRYQARRKMRWAVRRLRGMTRRHRMLFQLHSLQRKHHRFQLEVDAKLASLVFSDPWAASVTMSSQIAGWDRHKAAQEEPNDD